MVNIYLENYTSAINDLNMTQSIDPNLKAGELSENLANNIINMHKLIKNQAGYKPKKISQVIMNIPKNINNQSGYDLISVENRINNDEKPSEKGLISCKIIQIIQKNVSIPLSFICCDNLGYFFLVSIYNMSKDFHNGIKQGESHMTILDPVFKRFSFLYKDREYKFTTVKISDLSKLLIDGKQCSFISSASELTSIFFT